MNNNTHYIAESEIFSCQSWLALGRSQRPYRLIVRDFIMSLSVANCRLNRRYCLISMRVYGSGLNPEFIVL